MEKNYEEIYRRYMEYEGAVHKKNQRKIRTGLKVNVLLPLVFLIISFITSGSKLIFLVLWIVSLFGIAFYLIYVEYTDYEMQKRGRSFDDSLKDEEQGQSALVGQEIEFVEKKVNETIDAIDEQIEGARQQVDEAISGAIEEGKAKVTERLSAVLDDVSDAKTREKTDGEAAGATDQTEDEKEEETHA